MDSVFTPGSVTPISTGTTTLVATGTCTLHTLTVTGGTTGTIKVYDALTATGTPKIDFDTTNALATYTFDISLATGMTIVTSAATKITVSWLRG